MALGFFNAEHTHFDFFKNFMAPGGIALPGAMLFFAVWC